MDNDLYFDTRNKKGQKCKYNKDLSVKSRKMLEKKLTKEKSDALFIWSDEWDQLLRCSWYRIRHHHHCHMCHPRKEKVNKSGKPKTIFRKKEYKNEDFDISVI